MRGKRDRTIESRRNFIKKTAIGLASISAGWGHHPSLNASPSVPPNLLFIMTDQQTYNTLSCAGNTVISTPNLDLLAGQGVFFERTYSNNPVCVPTRSVIMTGHSSLSTGVRHNQDYVSPDVADLPTFDSL